MKINNILLVEDNAAICEAMSELLQLEGYTVVVANNGQTALALLKNSVGALPDLILLDLMMPVMDGVEFLRAQNSDEKIAHIPIFIMTANGVPLDIDKFNIVGFLKKPVDIDGLFETLRNLG